MDSRVAPAVKTTCPYCGVGCGIKASVGDTGVTIEGDPDHPSNYGRLCSKGAALGETLSLEDRLLFPEVDGKRASWDVAIDRVAAAFAGAIEAHGPDSVAFYVSGQLLTEDYYVANKLMKGFIGSANIDTNSRLCMASSVAGHRRAFGADTVPGTYEDLESADLIILVGSNLAWCHPVLYQRIAAAKDRNPKMRVVMIDPRRTATEEIADLHLPILPDTDVALFNGLLRWLSASDAVDPGYVQKHTSGHDEALMAVDAMTVGAVAALTGLSEQDIRQFYTWVEATKRTVTVYSQGVNQSEGGTDKVNAIINTHLQTGRIGQPGMGPFSVTGQPNAMGGREVGGLANMLACHMAVENPDHRRIVRDFWQSPAIATTPGLKAVDLFEAIHAGRIKALWVMATNPAVSMPDAGRVEAALRKVPFLAVSDVVAETDTLRHATVKLPAAAWGEKDGTVTNSERRISRQRKFLPLPGEARPDWKIISDVAARMGFGPAFAYDGPDAIFEEYARLSGAENQGARDFDISGMAGIDAAGYDRMAPFQWPRRPADEPGDSRFFASGGFYHEDRKARFVPVRPAPAEKRPPRYPFILNSGRVRDHWHTMTRTGRSPKLSAHTAEPYVEIHPQDAAGAGLRPAELARISGSQGSVVVRVLVTDRQQRGSLFVPMHWTDQTSADARIDRLVAPRTDPHSGQPALKSSPVAIAPWRPAWHAYAVLRAVPDLSSFGYWAVARTPEGFAVELADGKETDTGAVARTLIGSDDILTYTDGAAGSTRYAAFDGGRMRGAVFIAREPVAVSRRWASNLLSEEFDDRAARLAVLAGRPGGDRPDPGPTICACFSVGANDILRAAEAGADSVEAVGAATSAGTNCGSCKAEISRLLVSRMKRNDDEQSSRLLAPAV